MYIYLRAIAHMYVCIVYIRTHDKSNGKSTKKIPYMQIYMGNSFKNVDFATKIDNYSV